MVFQNWANQLHEEVVDRDKVEHDMCIVPAPFYAMCYIKDGRYLPGDDDRSPSV